MNEREKEVRKKRRRQRLNETERVPEKVSREKVKERERERVLAETDTMNTCDSSYIHRCLIRDYELHTYILPDLSPSPWPTGCGSSSSRWST